MSCRECNESLYDHVEGTLTNSQSSALKRHIERCPICPNFVKSYMKTHQARNQISPYNNIHVPETLPQKLIDAILETKAKA